MVGVNIVGNIDFASVAIWMFWIFFALLIFYLQTENMREGYPLEDEDGGPAANQGPFPLPKEKTWSLPHGRGERTVPDGKPEARDLALAKTDKAQGAPFMPTGDPMADGVGPASWAPRRDVPELDGKGHPKIVPMAGLEAFSVSAGYDPRGMKVVSGDSKVVGEITDMWVDEPEQLVRYLEFKLDSDGSTRLVPMQMAKVTKSNLLMGRDPFVKVRSLYAAQFAGVPKTASNTQVTLLEEDKICGYYAGGTLYASQERLDPAI
ncbi:MAG: photosynthetic reaction center subunit H [Pseudomonadota bacterium]